MCSPIWPEKLTNFRKPLTRKRENWISLQVLISRRIFDSSTFFQIIPPFYITFFTWANASQYEREIGWLVGQYEIIWSMVGFIWKLFGNFEIWKFGNHLEIIWSMVGQYKIIPPFYLTFFMWANASQYERIWKFNNLEIIWKFFGQWLVNMKLFLPFILPFSCEPTQVNMREFWNFEILKLFGNYLVNGWSIWNYSSLLSYLFHVNQRKSIWERGWLVGRSFGSLVGR